MEITVEKLRQLVSEAWDRGNTGCADLKTQDLEELFQKHYIRESGAEYRIWTVEQLKEMPEGTIFQHLIHGRCWIFARRNGTKAMMFRDGKMMEFFSNGSPWDKPMKVLAASCGKS